MTQHEAMATAAMQHPQRRSHRKVTIDEGEIAQRVDRFMQQKKEALMGTAHGDTDPAYVTAMLDHWDEIRGLFTSVACEVLYDRYALGSPVPINTERVAGRVADSHRDVCNGIASFVGHEGNPAVLERVRETFGAYYTEFAEHVREAALVALARQLEQVEPRSGPLTLARLKRDVHAQATLKCGIAPQIDFVRDTVHDYFTRKHEAILQFGADLPEGAMLQSLPRIEAIFTQTLEDAVYGPKVRQQPSVVALPKTMIEMFHRLDEAGSAINRQMQALQVEGADPTELRNVMKPLYTSLIASEITSKIMSWADATLQLPSAGFHSAGR